MKSFSLDVSNTSFGLDLFTTLLQSGNRFFSYVYMPKSSDTENNPYRRDQQTVKPSWKDTDLQRQFWCWSILKKCSERHEKWYVWLGHLTKNPKILCRGHNFPSVRLVLYTIPCRTPDLKEASSNPTISKNFWTDCKSISVLMDLCLSVHHHFGLPLGLSLFLFPLMS